LFVLPLRLPRPACLPDELRHAGRENLDASHVAHFDEREDANASEEIALLRDLGLGPSSHVVDREAGTPTDSVIAALRPAPAALAAVADGSVRWCGSASPGVVAMSP
jgi:hypothetical protein